MFLTADLIFKLEFNVMILGGTVLYLVPFLKILNWIFLLIIIIKNCILNH